MDKKDFDTRLDNLYNQTSLKNIHNKLDYEIRKPLYTGRIQNYHEQYMRTNQFDKNKVLSINKGNVQDLKYYNIRVGREIEKEKSRFNYTIDNHITRRPTEVSGHIFPNNELRVQPNRYVTPGKPKINISI